MKTCQNVFTMSFLKCIFIYTLLYSQCGARNKNPSLDQLKGPWSVSNASKNALPLIGECTSVEIEPPPKKSRDNKGKIFLETEETTYILTIVPVDSSTYQISDESFPLANLRILKIEINTFLVAEVEVEDEKYYAVLTNDNKTSEKVDKKIRKFWNSYASTKDVSLFPIQHENCQMSKDNNPLENNSVLIKTLTIQETYITDEALEDNPPVSQSERSKENTNNSTEDQSTTISAVTSGDMVDLRPRITIELGGSTISVTPEDSPKGPKLMTETTTQSLHRNSSEANSLITDRSMSLRKLPDLIFLLINLILFTI